jgi:adenylate kinase
MLVALTGTPGTGKSTASNLLRDEGYVVLDLNEIAQNNDFFISFDSARNTHEVDLVKLNKFLGEFLINNLDKKDKTKNRDPVILDGHIAHFLDGLDIVVVLRCHPKVLQQRLGKKNWSKAKVRENLEAEVLDVITIEVVERFKEDKIFEVDTTNDTPTEVINKIKKILKGETKEFRPGNIDWSEEILKWY